MAANSSPDTVTGPREPETEKGRLVREQYLSIARTALGESTLDYLSLYERYSQDQPAAQSLDQSVARAALQAGHGPRQVIQLLAQGPFTQHQTRQLSPEARKAALPGLLQYAQATVEAIQRQRFVDYANTVTGKVWNYPDLYREHIGSDLIAIQLDQKVAAAALQAGEPADAVVGLLQQGPYAQFQQDMKQMQPAMIEKYAQGTVAQVQEIQALRPRQEQRSPSLER
ncbi:MAG: hypothetical protein F6K19_23190 [Cyanothece sp. SIO1E1]|nr:hypothetical protein [Cyanothece sp. SIO1E1]